jgi:MoaA/NifB/PqqE/SkfB family radical SAM enzyme
MDDKITLWNVTIAPTHKCNLRCRDCYSNSGSNSERLDDTTIDTLLEDATKTWPSLLFFTLTGGEPFIDDIALNIARRHPDKYFQVYTNGLLIDERVAENIKELGNITPLISVEGWGIETDSVRGKGTYEKVNNVMNHLTDLDLFWGISFKLTSQNAHVHDEGFVDYFISKGAQCGRFLTYMPTGRGSDLLKVPSTEQRRRQKEVLERVDPSFLTVDYINNPTELLNGCAAAGLRYVYVDPTGDVHPCVFMPNSARFNLKDVYAGVHKAENVENLNDMLLKDSTMRRVRKEARKRSQERCCMILDS